MNNNSKEDENSINPGDWIFSQITNCFVTKYSAQAFIPWNIVIFVKLRRWQVSWNLVEFLFRGRGGDLTIECIKLLFFSPLHSNRRSNCSVVASFNHTSRIRALCQENIWLTLAVWTGPDWSGRKFQNLVMFTLGWSRSRFFPFDSFIRFFLHSEFSGLRFPDSIFHFFLLLLSSH